MWIAIECGRSIANIIREADETLLGVTQIDPGQSVVFIETGASNSATVIANFKSETRVDFGAGTLGVMFDNAARLNIVVNSQLSVVGVNGTILSAVGSELGSPGTIGATSSVSQPSSFALISFVLGAVIPSVRRRIRARAAV